MNETGKYEIINPNGDVVGKCDTYRKAKEICKKLENAIGGEYLIR